MRNPEGKDYGVNTGLYCQPLVCRCRAEVWKWQKQLSLQTHLVMVSRVTKQVALSAVPMAEDAERTKAMPIPIRTFVTLGLGLFILALPLLIAATMILMLLIATAPALILAPLLVMVLVGLLAGIWLMRQNALLAAWTSVR